MTIKRLTGLINSKVTGFDFKAFNPISSKMNNKAD